jgi:PGF-CTERM protein
VRREYVLAGAAVAVVAAAVGAFLVLPGVGAEPADTGTEREGHLELREAPIAPANATGDEVTLEVTNWLAHTGAPVENVSLLVRVTDTDSGLIATRTRTDVGTVDADGDYPVVTNVTVDRTGGYDIETLVFADDERVARGTASVDGLSAIRPDVPGSGLNFHRFGSAGLPTITYSIESAAAGDVRMNATAFLTNQGSRPAEDLELLIRARQSDSNIVADRAVVPVSDVRPGRTAQPGVSLTVPDNYTYRLDAVLTRDDVIVDARSAVADLDPVRNVSVNRSTESVDLDADDFDEEDDASVDDAGDRPETTATGYDTDGGNGPGFGAALALVAVLGTATLLARRHS